MTAITAALVGALIAGAFALVGATYSSRRERDHWLRDRRLAAYTEFLRVVDATMNDASAREARSKPVAYDEFVEVGRVLIDALSAVVLLGPADVANAAQELDSTVMSRLQHAGTDQDDESAGPSAAALLRQHFIIEAKAAMGAT